MKQTPPPPPDFTLPHFLLCCGVLSSAVLFIDGCHFVTTNWSQDWPNSEAGHQGWYYIGLAFFVGPLLLAVAEIIVQLRLDRRKLDLQREDESPSGGPTNPNLFPCPHCGHHVSRLATVCPKCKYLLTPERPSGAGGT